MKAGLFDLDGVLVDTEGAYSIFWASMGRKFRPDVPDLAAIIKGSTLENIYATYFPDTEVQKWISAELERHEREQRYVFFSEVRPFLEKLHASDIACAVVTSSSPAKIGHLFGQHPDMRHYFGAIITDEDVTRSKPDPQGYNLAAERLGVNPEDCVVFEDSFSGLMAGKAAGGKVVALATTNPREKLEGKADLIVDNLGQVPLSIFR